MAAPSPASTSERGYDEVLAQYVNDAFRDVAFHAPSKVASVTANNGTLAALRQEIPYVKRSLMPTKSRVPNWQALNPDDPHDRSVITFITGNPRHAFSNSPVVRSSSRDSSVQIDVHNAPFWMLPNSYATEVKKSRHAVYREAQDSSSGSPLWPSMPEEPYGPWTQTSMVFERDSRSGTRNTVPPSDATQSLQRIFRFIHLKASDDLSVKGAPTPSISIFNIDEGLTALAAHLELVNAMARMIQCVYRAHHQEVGNEPQLRAADTEFLTRRLDQRVATTDHTVDSLGNIVLPQVNILDCDPDQLPERFKQFSRTTAQDLLREICGELAKPTIHETSPARMIRVVLDRYIASQYDLQKYLRRNTRAQRQGPQSLSGREYLLNLRIINGCANVLSYYFDQVYASDTVPSSRLVDPIAAASQTRGEEQLAMRALLGEDEPGPSPNTESISSAAESPISMGRFPLWRRKNARTPTIQTKTDSPVRDRARSNYSYGFFGTLRYFHQELRPFRKLRLLQSTFVAFASFSQLVKSFYIETFAIGISMGGHIGGVLMFYGLNLGYIAFSSTAGRLGIRLTRGFNNLAISELRSNIEAMFPFRNEKEQRDAGSHAASVANTLNEFREALINHRIAIGIATCSLLFVALSAFSLSWLGVAANISQALLTTVPIACSAIVASTGEWLYRRGKFNQALTEENEALDDLETARDDISREEFDQKRNRYLDAQVNRGLIVNKSSVLFQVLMFLGIVPMALVPGVLSPGLVIATVSLYAPLSEAGWRMISVINELTRIRKLHERAVRALKRTPGGGLGVEDPFRTLKEVSTEALNQGLQETALLSQKSIRRIAHRSTAKIDVDVGESSDHIRLSGQFKVQRGGTTFISGLTALQAGELAFHLSEPYRKYFAPRRDPEGIELSGASDSIPILRVNFDAMQQWITSMREFSLTEKTVSSGADQAALIATHLIFQGGIMSNEQVHQTIAHHVRRMIVFDWGLTDKVWGYNNGYGPCDRPAASPASISHSIVTICRSVARELGSDLLIVASSSDPDVASSFPGQPRDVTDPNDPTVSFIYFGPTEKRTRMQRGDHYQLVDLGGRHRSLGRSEHSLDLDPVRV